VLPRSRIKTVLMINLVGTAQGLKVKLSVDGVKMTLKGS
jgi:hypothetical protein